MLLTAYLESVENHGQSALIARAAILGGGLSSFQEASLINVSGLAGPRSGPGLLKSYYREVA